MNGKNRCGGALVGRSHVVTAGHCVSNYTNPNKTPVGLKVYLGEYSLLTESEPLPMQKRIVTKVHLHPYYRFSPQADRYDVAVLRLDRPVRYEPHILPICLPPKNQEFDEGNFTIFFIEIIQKVTFLYLFRDRMYGFGLGCPLAQISLPS